MRLAAAKEGEVMVRGEVVAMVVAEAAIAGIKVVFFTQPTGPTYPSMAGWGSPAGSWDPPPEQIDAIRNTSHSTQHSGCSGSAN